MKSPWTEIERNIAEASSAAFHIEQRTAASGGDISAAWVVSGSSARYFVKTNDAARSTMFEAEAAGLEALRGAGAMRVPKPICHGSDHEASWIVLEHVVLRPRSGATDAALGTQLAALHRCPSERYGWHRDNAIGSTPQINTGSNDWPAFWRDQRLAYQLGLARKMGYGGKLQSQGEKLLEAVPRFFAGYTPPPSLLHGDLWSGNAAADEFDAPVIFDPAVYYGDREADIAMTELFGGYSPSFYAAYRQTWPLDSGYAVRRTLYNLYHVLNHLNLFGGGYLRQAEGMIAELLAQA
jgi:protein-ribulosamine 3-kinase